MTDPLSLPETLAHVPNLGVLKDRQIKLHRFFGFVVEPQTRRNLLHRIALLLCRSRHMGWLPVPTLLGRRLGDYFCPFGPFPICSTAHASVLLARVIPA